MPFQSHLLSRGLLRRGGGLPEGGRGRQLLWLIHSREPQLIKESDLIPEQKRLSAPLYLHCYKPFHIFDSLQ